MKILTLVQGSAEWHAHRATAFNASDAPAMLGISKYKSRSQLLKERATGIVPEVDDATQRRFNDGHRFEALARPLAEQIIGDTLSPVTGANGKFSASFDGITFDESVIFEHKTLNDTLREAEFGDDGYYLPEEYRAQMEHQLYVSGAERCLFMASAWDKDDNLLEERNCWYYPDNTMRQRLIAGWEQFEKDLAAYSPAAEAEKVTACAVMALPALAVQIRGEVTNSNLPVFVSEADKFLSGIKTVLETDQDFADAESNVKACKAAEEGIEATKKAITAQATSIDEVMRTMDLYKEKLSTVRLKLDKLVKSEKESRKLAIVTKAGNEFSEHILNLESEIKPIGLNRSNVSNLKQGFADAIKGLKKLSAMQEAVDTALRDAKFAADQEAKDVRAKLAWCKENAAGHSALFPDLQALMAKPMEDFTLTIATRIKTFHEQEQEKLDAVRAQAEADARAKIEAEQNAKQASVAAGRYEVMAQEAPALSKEPAGAAAMPSGSSATGTKGIVLTDRAAQPANRPSDDKIIEALVLHFRVHESKVIEWLLDMDLNEACERMAKEFA